MTCIKIRFSIRGLFHDKDGAWILKMGRRTLPVLLAQINLLRERDRDVIPGR